MAPDRHDETEHCFRLHLPDRDATGFFGECTGLPADAIDAVTWHNVTLRRGVDANLELWRWRELVIDGMIREARRDGTIELLDATGRPLATYAFQHGWPCRYSSPGRDAGGGEILVEEIEIAHGGLTRREG